MYVSSFLPIFNDICYTIPQKKAFVIFHFILFDIT